LIFSRELLIRGIIYQLQERAYGGLSKAAARKLEQAAAGPPGRGAAKPTPSVSLRPGTRLVREWHGVTHTALIHADGIEWRGLPASEETTNTPRFEADSLADETVSGEPVCEANSLLSGKKTGNFAKSLA
jgi:Protein of unknown function (DUF2924)